MRFFHLINNILISTDPNMNGGISRVNSILKKNFDINEYLIISQKKPDNEIESTIWLRCFGKSPILIFNFFKLIKIMMKMEKNSKIVLSDPQYSSVSFVILISNLLTKHKIFFLTHGLLFHDKKFFIIKKIYFLLITKLLFRFFSITSVSSSDSNTLKKFNFHNFIEIQNGVNMINPSQEKKYKFCLVGRNVASKNLDKYLEFLNFYYNQANSPNLKNSVLISDSIISLKTEEIKKLNIYSKLNIQDYEKILSQSEYIMSFSDYEGFGLALIEGISAGAIPICKFNASFNEILTNCKELIFLENDYQKIFQLIKDIENLDYENYKILVQKLKSITTKYSVENMVAKFDKYVFN
jgi:glycosyltransferase involved in cell wall biosynthesis